MNDAWGFDENDEQQTATQAGTPKALREAYKAQGTQLADLQKVVADLQAAVTKNAVADLIASQGVARSAAEYYKGEADPAKVTSWVNDMRTTFGGAPVVENTVQPVLNSDDQKRLEQMNQMGSNAAPASNMDTATQAVANASSREELLAAFANLR